MESNSKHNFFFISYSWKNSEVQDDVRFFTEHHVNHWIDKEGMRLTDDTWKERVAKTVFDEHCRGAVFYLSADSLQSDAVDFELETVKCKKQEDPDFFIIAIVIGGLSIPHLIKQVYDRTDDTKLWDVLPLVRIAKLTELFTDEKMLLRRDGNDLDSYYKTLMVNLTERGVIHTKRSVEDELLSKNRLDAYKRYSFGMFYDPEPAANVHYDKEDAFFERNGAHYIKLPDGTVHPAKKIKWIILGINGSSMKLITETAVESIAGSEIDSWLNGRFRNIAFSEEEKALLIGRIRTLTYDEYVSYSSESDINPTKCCFWLNSINIRRQTNSLMYVNGTRIDKIGKNKSCQVGIRPVIDIDINTILGGKA